MLKFITVYLASNVNNSAWITSYATGTIQGAGCLDPGGSITLPNGDAGAQCRVTAELKPNGDCEAATICSCHHDYIGGFNAEEFDLFLNQDCCYFADHQS